MMFRRRSGARRPAEDLTSCRSCRSDYVIPTEWGQRQDERWWIRVRCGECGESRAIVVSDAAAQRYDAELDRGMHRIARVLDRIARAEMAKEAEAFRTALEFDLVDADDFAR